MRKKGGERKVRTPEEKAIWQRAMREGKIAALDIATERLRLVMELRGQIAEGRTQFAQNQDLAKRAKRVGWSWEELLKQARGQFDA